MTEGTKQTRQHLLRRWDRIGDAYCPDHGKIATHIGKRTFKAIARRHRDAGCRAASYSIAWSPRKRGYRA